MVLDWKAIHPLNGSQADAFEELCAQLARAETPTGANFNRKGSPDAGVECFCVMPDGSEWGWQAKYFDTFGSSQWSQLDKSVRNALEKHRALVRYYVCVPMDRPRCPRFGSKIRYGKVGRARPEMERLGPGHGQEHQVRVVGFVRAG